MQACLQDGCAFSRRPQRLRQHNVEFGQGASTCTLAVTLRCYPAATHAHTHEYTRCHAHTRKHTHKCAPTPPAQDQIPAQDHHRSGPPPHQSGTHRPLRMSACSTRGTFLSRSPICSTDRISAALKSLMALKWRIADMLDGQPRACKLSGWMGGCTHVNADCPGQRKSAKHIIPCSLFSQSVSLSIIVQKRG